jgi:endonuclease YncB( thermonuclease family)
MCLFDLCCPVYDTAKDIPPHFIKEKRSISGIVVKVTDGDTVRIRHVVKWRTSSLHRDNDKLSDCTIAVRFAAVDAPETAKKGKPAQNGADDAKQFVTDQLLDKTVQVKLLSIDQYGRVIGNVSYSAQRCCIWSEKRNISEELVRRGYASVYRQGGAQYDGSIERWNTLENEAIKEKLGMWRNGKDQAQLPSEFKKQNKKVESRQPAADTRI